MDWDPKAQEEFTKIPVARSALENVKVTAEKFSRRKGSDRVTLAELNAAKKLCYGDVPEAVRLKELEKRIGEGETDLRERLAKEAREILGREIDLFNVELCHAQYFRCRSQIADVRGLKRAIERKLRELKVTEMVADSLPDDERLMAHHRFSVSISGCPNACTAPETRPFGIHGVSKPMVVAAVECSECFACVDRCRRGAIVIRDGGPRINVALCDRCENCVKVCPTGKIVSEQKGHRVLVGGKFGRFHQVGYELFKMADHDLLMKSLEASIQTIKENAVGEESLYSIINRLGVAPIFMRLYKGDELMTQKTTISVKGMNCQHCVDHVTKALGSLPGVSKVAVDLKTEKATVEFDPAKAGLTEMTRAIEKAGYRVAGSPAVSPETPPSGDSCC